MATLKSAENVNLPEQPKLEIIELFLKNVKGRKADTAGSNIKHSGSGGHWLEKQMGVIHNASNAPDIKGFEMKNHTTNKTTFGDWSANYYIFRDKEFGISRTQFMRIFGAPNPLKQNRYSWSGRPVPKIDTYNSFGQLLKVDEIGNISAMYSYEEDTRQNKAEIVPESMQKDDLDIAIWDEKIMKSRVERKFNLQGWFKCIKDKDGIYQKIVFGAPINFETWIEGVRKGLIFFDSGMYEGNSRNYSQWRADNKYWDALIIETYS